MSEIDQSNDGIAFVSAWYLENSQLIAKVKDFWAEQGMPPAVIANREKEICAVATHLNQVVAVSTATSYFHSPMRNKFFVYRCMVASYVRQKNVAWRISAHSLKVLQDWSVQNVQEKMLGLLINVETDKFEAGLRLPIREKFGFTMHFVGYSPAGQQLRVVWFDNAKLDDAAASCP